jgi:hypothetical protein
VLGDHVATPGTVLRGRFVSLSLALTCLGPPSPPRRRTARRLRTCLYEFTPFSHLSHPCTSIQSPIFFATIAASSRKAWAIRVLGSSTPTRFIPAPAHHQPYVTGHGPLSVLSASSEAALNFCTSGPKKIITTRWKLSKIHRGRSGSRTTTVATLRVSGARRR